MKQTRVNLGYRSYSIVTGNNILGSLGTRIRRLEVGRDAIVITNPVIKKRWGKKVYSLLIRSGFNVVLEQIPDTEKSKSAKTCLGLLNKIARISKSKDIFIIAFGGGVVGDTAGFIASIYKRGVPYIQLPTTLLAQIDSAIGGKVALDLEVGKNLVGAFYQPRLVFSDVGFLATLPRQQLVYGLAEAIKYGVIKDERLFDFFESNLNKIIDGNKAAIEFIVQRCSQIKARIVEEDEFDKLGKRAVLNYGHTIGHAIEAAAGYSGEYSHGKAISIGMAAANIIARQIGLLSKSDYFRIENLLKKTGLPVIAKGLNPAKIYKAHLYDKKFRRGRNRFVLPVRVGRVKLVEGIPENVVKKSIEMITKDRG